MLYEHQPTPFSRGDWKDFGTGRYGQVASIRDIWDLGVFDPLFDALDVSTLVECVEIVVWCGRSTDPHMRDEAHVNVAHDGLPQHFHTVFCLEISARRKNT